jgi:hypothetical protein
MLRVCDDDTATSLDAGAPLHANEAGTHSREINFYLQTRNPHKGTCPDQRSSLSATQRDATNPRKNCDRGPSRRIIVRLSVKSETGGYLTGSARLSRARCGRRFDPFYRISMPLPNVWTTQAEHSSRFSLFRHRYSFRNLDISQVRNEIILEALHCSILLHAEPQILTHNDNFATQPEDSSPLKEGLPSTPVVLPVTVRLYFNYDAGAATVRISMVTVDLPWGFIKDRCQLFGGDDPSTDVRTRQGIQI